MGALTSFIFLYGALYLFERDRIQAPGAGGVLSGQPDFRRNVPDALLSGVTTYSDQKPVAALSGAASAA